MVLKVKKANKIRGEITVPGDKSISHRAIMLGSLATGETLVKGFLPSADCLATIDCFRKMGIAIEMTNDKGQMSNEGKIIIRGKVLRGLEKPKSVLNVGNSGTTIRLLSGILAGQGFSSEITGDSSIQKRPMMRIVKPLREMGAAISGKGKGRGEGRGEIYAPLLISGQKLKGITYELPVASAQVKSAVLLAGLFADGKTEVIEKNKSRDHTERMMEYLGLGTGCQVLGMGEFQAKEIDIPGDLSSAAFFIVAALLTPSSELTIHNVGLNPTRTGIIDVLHRMGATFEVFDEQIISGEPKGNVKCKMKNEKLKGIKISGEIIPRIIDEFPIIAVAATQAEGITEIRGARELRVKESDRIKTIASELRKMGAKIKELDDGMIIEGPVKLHGTKVKSYGDHRIAMSLAIAGLIAESETVIDDTACIETSFPGFEGLLEKTQS
ncbi:MAG: 3-phosphoshikimate 1-carboxyvinyltransferase [Candidatus Margulisbacteria bacterium]|nr:3-phosphoshikimate 1-carboxyvinyltransferase [Candidatus Margulisiibacteriota bacterium]